MGKCRLDACANEAESLGLCMRHYIQQHRGRAFTFGPPREHGKQVPWLLAHVGYKGDDCLIWPFAYHRDGRGQITYERTTQQTHRVMCRLRHGEPPTPAHEAAHSCGRGHHGCVNPNHLRWATHIENLADQIAHDTRAWGERHYAAIITEDQVRTIRQQAKTHARRDIAIMHGLKPAHVDKIIAKTIWRHV